MTHPLLALWCRTACHVARLRRRLDPTRGEAGEGVISAAIAVLVMAFLGVAMWYAFQEIFGTATDNTRDQVTQIGA